MKTYLFLQLVSAIATLSLNASRPAMIRGAIIPDGMLHLVADAMLWSSGDAPAAGSHQLPAMIFRPMASDSPYKLRSLELTSMGVTVKEWCYYSDSVVFRKTTYGQHFSNLNWIGEVESEKTFRFFPNTLVVSMRYGRNKPDVKVIEIGVHNDEIVIGNDRKEGVMHVQWDSSSYSVRYQYQMLVREFIVKYADNAVAEMAIYGTGYHEDGLIPVPDSVRRYYFEMVGPAGSFHQPAIHSCQIRRREDVASLYAEENGSCGIRIFRLSFRGEVYQIDGCSGTSLILFRQNI